MNVSANNELAKKYEEKIKSIMQSIGDNSLEKVEKEMIDFEKIIHEEQINRIVATFRLNMALIAQLKESDYDFSQEKTGNHYESILNTTLNSLNSLNSNSL